MKEKKYTGVEIQGTNGKVSLIRHNDDIIITLKQYVLEMFFHNIETFRKSIPNEKTVECGNGKIFFEGKNVIVQSYSRITVDVDKEELKKAFNIVFGNCPKCQATPGGLHRIGCELEICPSCSMPYKNCYCEIKQNRNDGIYIPLDEDRIPWSG